MDLTLAVRVLPPVRGLGFLLGVDIGLTGTSIENAVRELAQNRPYNVMLGMSYAYDVATPPDPEPVIQEVERRVEVRVPPPPKGRINGLVVEQGPGTPIAGAIVRFPGTELSPIVSGDDGRFTTYQFDPGDIPMEISHEEYNPGSCVGTLAEEETVDVEVRCELVALPRVGNVSGRVVGGEASAAVSATVQISGPASRSINSDAAGNFNVGDLPPGSYHAQVDAEGYLIKNQTFEVNPRETTNIQIDLVERPRRSLVTMNRREIRIRRQINFATDSADILPTSFPLMTEIADVIIRNPDLTKIEVQGHTDNRGRPEHNLDLSQRRADSVRQWLLDNGVDSSRLDARGYGQDSPLVPNITPANRARNRRVQFMIQERANDPAGAAGAGE
jgi:outer membrane protein OmpA-like peptidoglycan-associated protein